MAHLLALLALVVGLQPRTALECVKLESRGRLEAGIAFAAPIPRGLQFRLRPTELGWDIEVVDPRQPRTDYMWLVSPPYRTAPQRMFGAGYNLTAAESASFERDLRFVLNAADHKRMWDVHQKWYGNSEELITTRQGLTLGTLKLRITDFALRNEDAFSWIMFAGEACAPR